MDKVLTIGIPSYNAECTLKECLNSLIIEEIIEDIQIIIVNDGSKDRTSEIGHSYEKMYPGSVVVIDKKNGGHGSGINSAVYYAVGKYIKIVDSDDAVDKNGIIELVNELKNTDADLVLSPYYVVKGESREFISYFRNNSALEKRNISINEEYYNLRFSMHSMTYRTKILKDSEYKIDEHCFYVDVEYSIFYLTKVARLLLLVTPVYCYTVGTENQSVNIKNMQKNIDEHTFVSKQLISFYKKEYKNIKSPVMKNLILENIINMILITEYRIIFSLPDCKDSKRRLLDIEFYLKNESMRLYDELIRIGNVRRLKIILLLSWLRRVKYFGYSVIRKLFWKRLKTF